MFRKRRQPAPFFRMPGAPFNPATGQRAPLGRYPIKETLLSIFQVIGDDPNDSTTEDTHENYIVCRGFDPSVDPSFRFLHDPFDVRSCDLPHGREKRPLVRPRHLVIQRRRLSISYSFPTIHRR